ncbi:unnamed protein product [Rotaria sordida]|uniref:Uncharacterized protein n=1 Tax=Rotaria sordida TaxID=392033 RepID=A0A813VXE4_9BILA|nr:unnamed protein product [Rotaria sordida]
MIHPKISSPSYSTLRKRRRTSSGKTLVGSAKSVRQYEKAISTESEDPVPIRFADLYKQEKARVEMGYMYNKKKKSYLIAPDTLIPNSVFRTVFKKKQTKPAEVKAFQLRLNKNYKNSNDQDDDEWMDIADPDGASEPTSTKKSKGTLVSNKKDTIPDIFKRMQNEPWWKQTKDEKHSLRSMLLYLIEILKLKQVDSFESACYYVTEIFRTTGIEPILINQILDILLSHLAKDEHDPLEVYAIRTISEFMIERKDIIVRLLEYVLNCQPTDIFRQEAINAIKFITDVNNSDDIDLILDDMSIVHNSPEDNFSLKMIIEGIENRKTTESKAVNQDEENHEIHPLLKKISEERWFPRGNFPLTLDYVLDAIIEKLPNATKTMLKTLTTHFVQLHHVIGYSNEQFGRVSNAIILLLSHNDADHRLITASSLVNLGRETKAIDIALLNSFLNDPRILVRTECCESLKKLTSIMSDTVLTDCANDISYIQTLPEENFSLQSYLQEKNRLPTPPPSLSVNQSPLIIEDQSNEENNIQINEVEQNFIINEIEKNKDTTSRTRSCSSSSQIIEEVSMLNNSSLPIQTEPNQLSVPSSFISSMTPVQPTIRVEINEKRTSDTPHVSRSRKERAPSETKRQKQTPNLDEIKAKQPSLLPNDTNMWDSYAKQNGTKHEKENNLNLILFVILFILETTEQKDIDESPVNIVPEPQILINNQEQINDPIQTILEEHKRTVGFYRMIQNRRILIPKKISMSNTFCDHSHMIINQDSLQLSSRIQNTMNLSNLNHNQNQLNEVEFIQLLSSLIVRALQVHRQHEKIIPGSSTGNFANALSISPMQIHTSSNTYQLHVNSPTKLPHIIHQRPTSRQFAHIQSTAQRKAAKEGINIQKAQSIEGALSNLMKTNREQKKSKLISSTPLNLSSLKQMDVTHAWLLVQLLKSQGTLNSENYLQKIIQSYPKFIPLLHTRIPQNLVPVIWNDPIVKQIASIFNNNKQDESTVESSSTKQTDTKQSIPNIDDEYEVNDYNYTTVISRDNHSKRFLPPIRGSKIHLPHHVLKFGFREIEMNPSESPNNMLHEENQSKSRKRRICMHLMMSANENVSDRHESVKSQLRHMVKTDYQTTSFMPIVSRPPMCH